MKFDNLTEDNIEFIKDTYSAKELSWDERMLKLMKYLGKSERTVRKWLVKLGIKQKQQEDSPQLKSARKKKISKKTNRYIITWAQNNTPVHEVFLRNMEAYASEIDAEIIIIAGRYKNPTSVFEDKEHETWHSRTKPYLYAGTQSIHKHLIVVGDVKISPTAVIPMTSMEGFSGPESCIFGHPKVQMQMVPVLEDCPPKKMMTTGACTLPNYTDSKAGKKGEFHHTLGFAIVEIKNKNKFFTRQVIATDDGNFNDFIYNVKFDGGNKKLNVVPGLTFLSDEIEGTSVISRNKEIEAAILGDIHFGEHDQDVIDATLNVLFKKLKPKQVILHDVFDGYSISHHDEKDPFAQFHKEVDGRNDLNKEIELMLEGLEPFSKYNCVIVRSNHDDFLDRWLTRLDWRKASTMKNTLSYFKFSTLLAERKAPKGIIPYVINERYPEMITLGRSDSHRVGKWELGQHGDVGASGSRGSINQFRRLNTKMIIGHSHSPNRKDGVIQVGTSTHLRVGYNIGPSSWLQSHAIIHSDGKAQQIDFIGGEFTTFE
ncbi:MAG TPA: hypothetical protein VMX17_13640 [Candidatus Glassbacteria bacterium]|nr:hypothetical protein [Candidatus Glassbacteria bacterium]